MKTWDVTVRGAACKAEVITISAETRADVFAELKKLGKNAIRIEESSGKKPRKAEKKAGSPAKGRGLLAAAIVVLGAGVAAWWMWPEREQVVEENEKVAKKVVVSMPEKSLVGVSNSYGRVRQEKNGNDSKVTHKKGEIWFTGDGKKMITIEKDGVLQDVEVYVRKHSNLAKTSIFQYPSENQIASLLRVEAGTGVFGNRDYKGFKENFLESLKCDIEILDDDDEWTRKLKQDVKDTKIELKKRLDAGEDIEAMMRDTREELRKLARVKRLMEQEAYKLVLESTSEEDIEAIKEATNKLLEEKGISPIQFNPIIERRILELKGGKNE